MKWVGLFISLMLTRLRIKSILLAYLLPKFHYPHVIYSVSRETCHRTLSCRLWNVRFKWNYYKLLLEFTGIIENESVQMQFTTRLCSLKQEWNGMMVISFKWKDILPHKWLYTKAHFISSVLSLYSFSFLFKKPTITIFRPLIRPTNPIT